MLKKSYRLTWKDVRYLVNKRNYFMHGLLSIYYVPQYPNRSYNQFSVVIWINISKNAVMRHFIKRIVMNYISAKHLEKKSFNGKWYKCFIMVHKAQIPNVQKIVANKDRNAIQKLFFDACVVFFTRLYNCLWVSLQK
jgi:hypothetical protein